MSEATNYRMDRIQRLLDDLKREVEIGFVQREIDETLMLRWLVPVSSAIPGGAVFCEFRTQPIPFAQAAMMAGSRPNIRLVGGK